MTHISNYSQICSERCNLSKNVPLSRGWSYWRPHHMWLVCPFVTSLWENLLAVTAWCSQGNKTWCFSSLTAATYKATKDMQELLTLGKNWISVFFHPILIKPLARSKALWPAMGSSNVSAFPTEVTSQFSHMFAASTRMYALLGFLGFQTYN